MTTLAEALATALRNLRDEQRAIYYAHDIDSQVFTDLLAHHAVQQALAAMVASYSDAMRGIRLLAETAMTLPLDNVLRGQLATIHVLATEPPALLAAPAGSAE